MRDGKYLGAPGRERGDTGWGRATERERPVSTGGDGGWGLAGRALGDGEREIGNRGRREGTGGGEGKYFSTPGMPQALGASSRFQK